MDFFQILSVAKLFSIVEKSRYYPLSFDELDAAAELLKQLANQSQYWTYEQKEMYKLLVDFVKEQKKQMDQERL